MPPGPTAPVANLQALVLGAAAFANASAAQRAGLLTALRRALFDAADDLVGASLDAKGWRAVPHAPADEWASGPLPVARMLMALAGRERGAPPRVAGDRLFLRGLRTHVECVSDRTRAAAESGGVALVLGAGNVTATPLLDVLEQVFVRGRACVLKPSPLHSPLLSAFARALRPLVDAGLLRLVPGDATVARELACDARITAVHLTGASSTWLTLADDPQLATKHLSAEVGCCTPALVVPGGFAARELAAVAEQLAAYVAVNGGATCLAPRVLLTAREWPQREALLQAITSALAMLPPRAPFHPSVRAHFVAATGREPAGVALAPTLCRDAGAAATTADCTQERFAPVLREIALPAADVAAYAAAATAFARERCFGSLSAYVFAPAALLRGKRAALDAIVSALPHGTVAINTWTGLGYGLANVPWGVPADVPPAHGRGFVRDLSPVPRSVRRVVVEAPLSPWPLPPWLPRHRRGAGTLRALTRFYLRPSARRFVAVLHHGLRP